MIEVKCSRGNEPKIKVIGIGGGGNNAIERMIESGIKGVEYVSVNTDIQILDQSKANSVIQIGKKLTNGFGAGADPSIGEAAAGENEEDIKKCIEGTDLAILTCGMGGGTGTGAIPVIAKLCKDMGILTVAVVTTPFSFENTPRMKAAQSGLEKLKDCVDTLLVIPNDRLLSLSEKPMLLEDAFMLADSVLKFTIEGMTNIVYNKGIINVDFNDLKTILKNKGIGHFGIGTVDADKPVLDAVNQAINSSFLDTTVKGAENILINTCGKINLISLNEAINYLKEVAAPNANFIWGTVTDENSDPEKVIVTVIATGLSEKRQESMFPGFRRPEIPGVNNTRANIPRDNIQRDNIPRVNIPRTDTSWADTSWADTLRADTSRIDIQRADIARTDFPRSGSVGVGRDTKPIQIPDFLANRIAK